MVGSVVVVLSVFFFKQKTAYEMRISDWSSDVCSSDLLELAGKPIVAATCYCHSCQAAGKEFAALPGAPAVVGADGGTPFVLMRKDRLTWLSGSDRLG